MSIKRLQSDQRMSQIVIHNNTVYLSGQVGEDAPYDIDTQTQRTLDSIDLLLKEAGTDKSHILSATIYLSDIKYFDAMNKYWDSWVDPKAPPCRATIEAKLCAPEYLIEISVIAALV